jgi:protein-L-isoaspartate(D-aspartate) O-methyltransferase
MDTAGRLQQELVDALKADGTLHDQRVEAAFHSVPRHLFLPGVALEEVYRDQAIVTKRIDGFRVSSSSQPAIMAVMLEQLGVQPGQRVLEIGAGTGYNAALLAHLVGEAGQVVTMDIDDDIVQAARRNLLAAGLERVQVIAGDGALGYAAGAPYDRIVLTVGAWDIAPAWWDQLRPGGRLVLPLALRGPETQRAIAFDLVADHLESASVRPCGFMLLRGPLAGPMQQIPLRSDPGVLLVHDQPGRGDIEAVVEWLRKPSGSLAAGVRANALAVGRSLNLWLALHDHRFCAVTVEATGAGSRARPPLPSVYGRGGSIRTSVGLLGEQGLALVSRRAEPTGDADGDEWSADAPWTELEVYSFGAETGLAERLQALVREWDAVGRPTWEGLSVKAYRRAGSVSAPDGRQVVTKDWTRLVLDWS